MLPTGPVTKEGIVCTSLLRGHSDTRTFVLNLSDNESYSQDAAEPEHRAKHTMVTKVQALFTLNLFQTSFKITCIK